MLLRRLAATVILATGFAGIALAADDTVRYHVGESGRLFHPDQARNWRGAKTKALLTRVWYPVDPSVPEMPHDIGVPGHPVFRGHPVAIDAPLASRREKYPLILLSHGTGGGADSLDWLGAALASSGYVVVGVNHPGNNALEPLTGDGFILWWERALDVSEALDGILADPSLGSHIDRDRIGAVGYSLGGYTVLELAGARTDRRAFENFCNSPSADAICHPPEMKTLTSDAKGPASLSSEMSESLARSGASYEDKRVKAVFVIAPALGEAFDGGALAEIHIPVTLIAGAADVTVPIETNIKRIAGFLPKANVTMLPGVSHYTFLDRCLPSVTDHLPLICKDGPGVDRDAIHTLTIEQADTFFAKALAVKGS